MEQPFLSFFTPTYKRPKQLANCFASVASQTAVEHIEQIVLPDHIGLGIVGGLYGRLPWYARAARGEYVHVLADDDTLVSPTVVEEVMTFARANGNPEVIVVMARKGALTLPSAGLDPPHCGHIDMGCMIQRRDIYQRFVGAYCTGRYEGDYDHAFAMWQAGVQMAYLPLLFVQGPASMGNPGE